MLCVKCKANLAMMDKVLGLSPYCADCLSFLKATKSKIPEFTTEEIKENRLKYSQDIEQPHRKGELNKAWLEVNPRRAERAKQMGFSDQEIKDAKYVYSGELGHSYYKKY